MLKNSKKFSFSMMLIGSLMLSACATIEEEPISGEEGANAQLSSSERTSEKSGPIRKPSGRKGSFAISEYRIGADDVILVSVWRNPELTVTVPVRPDGKVSLPLIGDVDVGGYTPMEVARAIEAKLRGYVKSPNVSIILTELRSHEFISRVRITGAVRNPQSIPYRQGMTVLDAILVAGGVNEFSAPNRSKLYRKTKQGTKVFDIELDDILTEGDLKTNLDVRPGDIITVPERLF